MPALDKAFRQPEHPFLVVRGNERNVGNVRITIDENERDAPFRQFFNIFFVVGAAERVQNNAGYPQGMA